jgi:hypothetical protein
MPHGSAAWVDRPVNDAEPSVLKQQMNDTDAASVIAVLCITDRFWMFSCSNTNAGFFEVFALKLLFTQVKIDWLTLCDASGHIGALEVFQVVPAGNEAGANSAGRLWARPCSRRSDSLVTSREAYEIAMRFFHGTHKVSLWLDDGDIGGRHRRSNLPSPQSPGVDTLLPLASMA